MPLNPLLLSELTPPSYCRVPLALRAISGMMGGTEGQARVHLLLLEGEYELEIPPTQGAIDDLYQVLRSLTTNPLRCAPE